VARRFATFGLTTVGDLIEHFPAAQRGLPRPQEHPRPQGRGGGPPSAARSSGHRRPHRQAPRRRGPRALRDDTEPSRPSVQPAAISPECSRRGCASACVGTFRPQGGRQSFVVKGHEILDEEAGRGVHTEGVVPCTPPANGSRPKLLRGLVHAVSADDAAAAGPAPGRAARARAPARPRRRVTAVHMPRTLAEATRPASALVIEELLLMQVGLLLHKAGAAGALPGAGPAPAPGDLSHAFSTGAFEPHGAPASGAGELEADLRRERRMRRQLQGDVGSGKTVVALYCWCAPRRRACRGCCWRPTGLWRAITPRPRPAGLVGPAGVRRARHRSLTRQRNGARPGAAGSGETRIAIGHARAPCRGTFEFPPSLRYWS